MSGRAARLAPLLAVLCLAAVPYRELFTPRVPVSRDLLFYFYPIKAHLAEAVRAGEVPWIDRYRWGGVGLLGSPGAAAFDPGNLLFVLLPLATAAKAWILLRLATAIAGFAALARRLGLTDAAAGVAGLVFGLGGVCVSLTPFLGALSALSILPWFAAFLLDVRQSADRKAIAGLALSSALLVLASVPELLFHALVLALFLLPPSLAPGPRPRALRVLAAAALAGAIGLGIGAVSLVPASRVALESTRGPGGGTNLKFAGAGALPLVRLKELLADGLVADWTEVGASPEVREYPYLPSLTPGRVALVLALAGLLAGGPGRGRAAFLSVLGILLALGPATPVWTACARAFPPLAAVRYPEKHAILTGFGLAWLAALGLRALERRLGTRAVRVALPLLALAVLLDRERTARGLTETADGSAVRVPPPVLAALPPVAGDAPPLRLFHRDSYAPVPAFDVRDLAAANRTARRTAVPEYATLFGRASLYELDYDVSLPREAFEWTRLLSRAVPAGGPLPHRLLRASGIAAEIASERLPDGSWAPRLRAFKEPLAPYRFVRRVVADGDGRRLFGRMLDEAFDPETAYVTGNPTLGAPLARGHVLSVRDRASALTLEVEVPARTEGFLSLYRLRSATVDAVLDGRPIEVLDVWFGFSGIVVPAGRHRVVLRPDTRWVKMSATVTAGSLVALILVSLLGRRAIRGLRGPAESRA